MARKQVLFLIVEGKHDNIILRDPLSALLRDAHGQEFVVMPIECLGDLLTRKPDKKGNDVVQSLRDRLQMRMNQYGLEAANVFGIVHVVDTDGCYVPDQAIVPWNAGLGSGHRWKAYYMDKQIIAKDVRALRRRNQYKQNNIDTLISTNKIDGLPYKVYYMSCNVEHVFGGDRNCSTDQKKQISNRLAKEYAREPSAFRDILTDYGPSSEDWLTSWDKLRQGVCSLKRGTNVRFAIPGL